MSRITNVTRSDGNRYTVVDMWVPTVNCCICNAESENRWGIPVDSETAEITSNESDRDWGAVPACRECFERHERGEFVGTYPRF